VPTFQPIHFNQLSQPGQLNQLIQPNQLNQLNQPFYSINYCPLACHREVIKQPNFFIFGFIPNYDHKPIAKKNHCPARGDHHCAKLPETL